MPFSVGSNWHGYRVYDHCWRGADIYETYHTITSLSSDNVYKVQQVGPKTIYSSILPTHFQIELTHFVERFVQIGIVGYVQ